MPQIAIIAALKAELAAVRAALPPAVLDQVALIQGGVGPEAAARAAESLLRAANPPQVICSTGFCGGLVDGLEVGDIVLAERVCSKASAPPAALQPDAALLQRAAASLRARQIRQRTGALVSTDPAVTGCAAKRALAAAFEALAVDMESHAIAAKLAGSTTRLLVMRAVSDGVQDELPPEITGFLTAEGHVRLSRVASYCLSSPRHLGTLLQLRARSAKAAEGLSRAWQAVWPLLD